MTAPAAFSLSCAVIVVIILREIIVPKLQAALAEQFPAVFILVKFFIEDEAYSFPGTPDIQSEIIQYSCRRCVIIPQYAKEYMLRAHIFMPHLTGLADGSLHYPLGIGVSPIAGAPLPIVRH